MARFGYAQTFSNSCGAVCTMVAYAELENVAAFACEANEKSIYIRLQIMPGDYVMPDAICTWIGERRGGHTAQVVERLGKVGETVATLPLRAGGVEPRTELWKWHSTYENRMKVAGSEPDRRDLVENDLDPPARVIMACLRPTGGLHYVLLRKDNTGLIWAMNASSTGAAGTLPVGHTAGPRCLGNHSDIGYTFAQLTSATFGAAPGDRFTYSGIAIVVN